MNNNSTNPYDFHSTNRIMKDKLSDNVKNDLNALITP